MKKTGVLIGTVCIAAAVLYFLVTARMGKVTAADFLPGEILVYVEQRDLGLLLDEFKVSRLGRAVTGIDTAKIATDLGLPPEEINKVRDGREQVEDFLASPVFQELLGQNFTLALLPVPETALNSPEKALTSSLVFIAKPRLNTDILKLIGSLFAGKLEPTSTQHGKHSFQNYLLKEGTTLSVATVEGYVIAAFDERLVQESLDRYDNKLGTLTQNKEYIRLRQDFIDAKFFSYVSLPTLHDQVVSVAENLDPVQKEDVQKAIAQWQGWQGLAFGAWKEKGKIRDKGVVLFKRDQLAPLVAKMCAVQPMENKTLAMIPADVLGYYWTNTLSLSAFWEMFTQEMQESAEQLRAMEQDVKTGTGLELQELFAMFGSEAVILLKNIATDGFIPLPNGAIFVKVEKEDEFVKLAQSLLTKAAIPAQTEEYKGVKLISLGVSLHPSLQPVYTVHQGYLILASTVDLVKKIIDNQGGTGGIIGDASFQQLDQDLNQGLTQANNSVSFVRFASLLQMMKDLANWGGTMLSMQDPEAALRSKVVLEQLILPLLDGLAMYEVIGSRSVIHDDAIILESATMLAP